MAGSSSRKRLRPGGRSWLLPIVKVALILLALCACERADSSAKKQPPRPTPTKPDPIKQAHDEFELLPADYAVGTHKLYSRGEFMPDADPEAAFDEGDFVGRLRTLFGARDGDQYVLRHKQTGYVITAYSGDSGPAYGGGARYPGALPPADPKALIAAAMHAPNDPAVEARKKADPILANGSPIDHTSKALDLHAMNIYLKHLDDAEAGPALASAVARLDALLSAVPPADWEKTYFYDEGPVVMHVGAKAGHSFADDLPTAEGFEFLAKEAASGEYPANEWLVIYYLAHKDELADQRKAVEVAYKRLVAAAQHADPDERAELLEETRDLGKQLHAP